MIWKIVKHNRALSKPRPSYQTLSPMRLYIFVTNVL